MESTVKRNPNPNKIRHGLYAKNQVKYDPRQKVYIKHGIKHYAFCTRCGTRCYSGIRPHKNYTHFNRTQASNWVKSYSSD